MNSANQRLGSAVPCARPGVVDRGGVGWVAFEGLAHLDVFDGKNHLWMWYEFMYSQVFHDVSLSFSLVSWLGVCVSLGFYGIFMLFLGFASWLTQVFFFFFFRCCW